jgi:hypothetical protein
MAAAILLRSPGLAIGSQRGKVLSQTSILEAKSDAWAKSEAGGG